jgi:Icc-related predicted phosphoesterase
MKRLFFSLIFFFLLITSTFAETLVIGHITDPHIGLYSFKNLKNAVDSLQVLADVIVVTGDITGNGRMKDYLKFMTVFEGTKTPYLIVPGNHDVMIKGNSIWNQVFGSTESYVDIGIYRIIGINSLSINWNFLDQALNTNQISIVVGHFPIFPRFQKTTKKYMTEKEGLVERFNKFEVPIYIHGHEHTDYLEYDQYPETYYLSSKIPPNFQLIYMENREVKEILSGKMSIMEPKTIDIELEE